MEKSSNNIQNVIFLGLQGNGYSSPPSPEAAIFAVTRDEDGKTSDPPILSEVLFRDKMDDCEIAAPKLRYKSLLLGDEPGDGTCSDKSCCLDMGGLREVLAEVEEQTAEKCDKKQAVQSDSQDHDASEAEDPEEVHEGVSYHAD